MTSEISKYDDVIDVRDIIQLVEDLETILGLDEDEETQEVSGNEDEEDTSDEREEYATLKALLDDLAGDGGDEQWCGDWYPGTLIRDSYFTEYAQELVSDIGDMPREIPSYIVIDWEATAHNIQQDYSSIEFDGVTYWYR